MINHKQALIIFWTLIAIFTISSITVYVSQDKVIENELIIYLLFIGVMTMFPILILIALIPTGYFEKKVKSI